MSTPATTAPERDRSFDIEALPLRRPGRWIWAIGAGFSVLAGFVAVALSPRLRHDVPAEDAELERAEAASL